MTLDTMEWLALAAIVGPWAVTAAVILTVRSFGSYSEERRQTCRELQAHRDALQASHAREIAAFTGTVDALKELIRVREENATLRQREKIA